MQILESINPNFFTAIQETCVCIGMFDGVHKGHQLLILKTVHAGKENRQPSVLLTFQDNPKFKSHESCMLSSGFEKAEMIKSLGIDYLVNLPFPGTIADMKPLEFVDSILVSCLHASNIFIGKNFRFGFRRSGNSDDLKYIGSERNMHVMVEQMMNFDGKEISSTFCRFLVHTQQFEKLTQMLGYPYFISGTVIHGQGRGGKIGLPTINLKETFSQKLKPSDGVFITKTLIRGQLYNSLTLYGPVPSFNQCEKTMETLVLDFEEEIYEEKVTVFFHAYLRGIEKFNTPKELTDQIDKDIKMSLDFHKNPSKLSPILAFLKQS